MRFKQAIKRIAALGTGATMVGATVFGAFAQADLAQYPNQYVKDGKFAGVLVVGDKAAAEDVIGVSDIAVSLQFAATKPAGSGGGSSLSASGEAWKVGTTTKILEMAESVRTGSKKESIATITTQSFIDDTELPNLLASQTARNSKGDSPYEQRLYFEDLDSGYVTYVEDTNTDVTADYLYFPNSKQIARYELEFTTALESDIDDSAGSQTSTGTFLTDIEDTDLVMLGKTFSVVQARRISSAGGVKLILMGGAVKDTLLEGNTKTYTIGGNDYETTVDFVDANSAKLTINGEGTRDLLDGETDKLSDGITIGVSEILYQDYAGGVHSVEFFLGAQKLELRDDTVTDTATSKELKVDDETIDGADVTIEATDDNTSLKIDKIIINMTADDDYFVAAGGKLSGAADLDEPDLLFTRNWDIEYQGLSGNVVQMINIKSSGSDDYNLEFVDGKGNAVKMPLVHTSGTSVLKLGDNDDDLVIRENQSISKNDYFIITDESDTNGERQSFALRYKNADKISSTDPKIKFQDLGSGDTVERPLSAVGSIQDGIRQELAQIKLGGGTFRVYNTTSALSNDFDIVVDQDGSGGITNTNVGLNTQYGAAIKIQNQTTDSVPAVLVDVSTPNSDDYDDLVPGNVTLNITATSGEVRLALYAPGNYTLVTPEDDDKNTYGYTSYGAFIRRSIPTSDPQEFYIEYPLGQRVPQVYVTGIGASFSSSPATTSGAVTVQRIDVGATKLASEVPNINAVNSILVGGPCANAAAAKVMGSPADCTAGFEPGVGRVAMWEVGSGNVAMLVAGYSAADTRNAAAVVSNYQDHSSTLKGAEVEVRKVNNVLTVAKPSEEVMEEDDEAMEEA
jgi:hypothetical protein